MDDNEDRNEDQFHDQNEAHVDDQDQKDKLLQDKKKIHHGDEAQDHDLQQQDDQVGGNVVSDASHCHGNVMKLTMAMMTLRMTLLHPNPRVKIEIGSQLKV